MKGLKTLVIGAGEVGQALKEVIGPFHETYIRDMEEIKCDGPLVLQICYPDSKRFVDITKGYIEQYKPLLTIINSSVAVGTTYRCGSEVVYSPIRGRHPANGLAKELKAFPKFVSSVNEWCAVAACRYFEDCGWKTVRSDNPETLEYLKLMSNVHMGLEIAWRQEVGRMMKHFSIQPKDYEAWEKTYNEGYIALGQTNLIRPLMRPDPIGGHCILPCTEILKQQFPSKALDFVLESNEEAKRNAIL